MKKIYLVILLSIIIVMFSLAQFRETDTAYAGRGRSVEVESTIQKITIITGIGDYSPYQIGDSEPIGLLFDVLNAVATDMNYKFEYRFYPWQRCLYMMEKNDNSVDCMIPPIKTGKREHYMYFNDKNILAYEENAFFVLSESTITFDGNFKSMEPYTIGTVRGYSYGEEFDNYKPLTMNPVSNVKQLITMLIARRLKVIIGNKDVINYLAAQSGYARRIKMLHPYVSKDALYLVSRLDKKEVADRIGFHLNNFKKTRQYRDILLKYGIDE